ncbi:sulfur carrier protein ThiS [Aquariibacter albus]|uniref:Sulfur carrier protein ThiS n=1 Tax=Aquariibacter albus TaxID=2759899 RepID=A0A839HR06_9BURK|nr:sulfur carrier protein ThiS [Aquariibacter albus]MBB1162028.1 sulfur carrier protein ThiS [Aquariibacter albus]
MSPLPEAALVLLDGEPRPLVPGTTLAALLEAEGPPATAIATAVNGRFVPRTARAGLLLQPGDVVLRFQAIVGG